MRFLCHKTRNFRLVLSTNTRLRAQPTCRLSFSSLLGAQSSTACLADERSKFGIMSSALRSSISQTQQRSFVSQKTNGTVSNNNGINHEHHHDHKHSLFGGHEHDHDHDHGTDAEKVIQALKGGGELSASLAL